MTIPSNKPTPQPGYNTPAGVRRLVISIISDRLARDRSFVTDEATLFDLQADSLDVAEIMMDVEDAFSIRLNDHPIPRTVGEFIALVMKVHLGPNVGPALEPATEPVAEQAPAPAAEPSATPSTTSSETHMDTPSLPTIPSAPDYQVVYAANEEELQEKLLPLIQQGYQPGNIAVTHGGDGSEWLTTFAYLTAAEIQRLNHMQQAAGMLMEQMNSQARMEQHVRKAANASHAVASMGTMADGELVTLDKSELAILRDLLLSVHGKEGEEEELLLKITKLHDTCPE